MMKYVYQWSQITWEHTWNKVNDLENGLPQFPILGNILVPIISKRQNHFNFAKLSVSPRLWITC